MMICHGMSQRYHAVSQRSVARMRYHLAWLGILEISLLRSVARMRYHGTVEPRNTASEGTNQFHLLLADFVIAIIEN